MRRSTAVNLGAVSLMATGFAGCGETEENVYCFDGTTEEVVENQFCGDEDDGGSERFFLFYAGTKVLKKGQKVGFFGQKISSLDKAAIRKAGGFGKGSSSGVGSSIKRSGGGG